jgi:hypothetical protein
MELLYTKKNMETIMENALVILAILFLAGIACAAFIASPYEIQFEDAEGIEEI